MGRGAGEMTGKEQEGDQETPRPPWDSSSRGAALLCQPVPSSSGASFAQGWIKGIPLQFDCFLVHLPPWSCSSFNACHVTSETNLLFRHAGRDMKSLRGVRQRIPRYNSSYGATNLEKALGSYLLYNR